MEQETNSKFITEPITVFKKVNIYKDGSLHPLFIDKNRPFVLGKWMHCEYHPTSGFKPRSVIDNFGNEKTGGWHCCFEPYAPHLSDELKNGHKRVWLECLAKGNTTVYKRPWNQGGNWILVEWLKPVRILENDKSTNNTEA